MNSIEKNWRFLLDMIYCDGKFNKKDDSTVQELMGLNLFVENPVGGNFLESTPQSFIKLLKSGALDVKGYPMTGEAMASYVEEFYDDKNIRCFGYKDGFVYTYPERLMAMRVWDKNSEKSSVVRTIDQIDVMINRLKENLGTNRAVATLYNCGLDKDEQDIPCLNWVQATVRDYRLVLHVMFRSNDIYGAWPSNMMFLTNLGLEIVYKLNALNTIDNLNNPRIDFAGIDYHVASAHIYENDLKAVGRILEVK